MGLRTASVRRPDAEVMAPALTDTAQPQNFNLPPKNRPGPGSRSAKTYSGYAEPSSPINTDDLSGVFINLNPAYPKDHSDGGVSIQSMSPSPPPMGDGDADSKMGLEKTTASYLGKVRSTGGDIEQLFGATNLEANVEDIMQQVMKHMDGGDQLNNSSSDLNEVLDLDIDKDLLAHVNVMMDDQQDDLETAQKLKENQARMILVDLQRRHARIERRLDFLRRRVCKLQSRHMGQHVSGEVAGVFEHVYRSLRKPPLETPSSEGPRPMAPHAAKSLVRKIEMAAMLQARQRTGPPRYFGSGSVDAFRNCPPSSSSGPSVSIPAWGTNDKHELQRVSEQLRTQLRLVQRAADSDATESSSGGESCDEMQTYSNPHQQYLSIQKRALWKYSTERAAIAARWTWLQSQISDLEYRIRQHTELHKQIRASKGPVRLDGDDDVATSSGAVNGYRGQLPGAPKNLDGDAERQCARTRPLAGFRKRKLLQVAGLHAVSKKAARPSTVRCSCVPPSSCALCTGRADPTYPRDSPDTLSKTEKVSLLDPGFHPVLSLPEDSSQGVHLEAVMKMPEWQQRSVRMKTAKAIGKADHKSYEQRSKKSEYRKKYGSLKQSTVSALSEKIKNKIRGRKVGRPSGKKRHLDAAKPVGTPTGTGIGPDWGDDLEVEAATSSLGARRCSMDSAGGSPLLQMQSISGYRQYRNNRADSYDIDNIVIPYSIAASTRVEKLEYKEILTPKWRISDLMKNNGAVPDFGDDSDVEDLSEESVVARHDRCEHDERKKFLSYLKLPFGVSRQRPHKRQDSLAESSGANTPDPMSPHPPLVVDGDVPSMSVVEDAPPLPSVALMRRRTISQSKLKDIREEPGCPPTDFVERPPYDARSFPLPDDDYRHMVEDSPPDAETKTNARAQDCSEYAGGMGASSGGGDTPFEGDRSAKMGTDSVGDSESTESAIGDEGEDEFVEDDDDDDEEDPNDPEWTDIEKLSRERHRR
ncbi:KAT8 regulatory NSL complex subunit 1 [Cylas formicarius]|uniref:KAT8 regulatory NSL complex subunit 1 n=1 Tax=Cylas formicarius TaxID=197179 RepID=UPI0029583AB7|nr:KAT8 regulatory NSL complex subunit 1 [Cylas formicarius]XP_060526022.1 KAT8 regulatory NSL complex subunit 1 [Cylas formicarius]